MHGFNILAWQPLLRPTCSLDAPPPAPPMQIPLKALSCRNQCVSLAALVLAQEPVEGAKLVVGELVGMGGVIPHEAATVRLVNSVPTPEAGLVCDPVVRAGEFSIDGHAALYIALEVPRETPPGIYRGKVALKVGGEEVAKNGIELEVADVVLPDTHDWSFFLNVWMNPAPVARIRGVEMWSDEHFRQLEPYVVDLAFHGQKTAVIPICHQPWGAQTRDPYPNAVIWRKRGGRYEFDFSIFDRYVQLHAEHGIDRAIHCYSIVQGPGATDQSVIAYIDADTGAEKQMVTHVGDSEYVAAWGAFFKAFAAHLEEKGWLKKTYIGFDEKPDDVMERLVAFLDERAPDFRVSLAGNTREDLSRRLGDLSVHPAFDDRGIAESTPPERTVMGLAELLSPYNVCAETKRCRERTLTTFYVCCGPEHPNTFVHSPLVESRMLPFLALQGGYDGFLRWSYNDWPDNPYARPEWGNWPTGDTFLVYPGANGPVPSLRWQQLREGICDYELALIASANIHSSEEMVDYEQAITLACRNPDGREKSIGDIEIARRLLIPIAEHQSGVS